MTILLISALEILNSTLAWYLPGYARLLFGKPVDGHPQRADPGVGAAASAHHPKRPGRVAKGDEIFSPEEVLWGVVESNGTLSVARTPQDGQEPPLLPILIDRHLYSDNLQALHLDETWLEQTLAKKELTRTQVLVLLANGSAPCWSPKSRRQRAHEPPRQSKRPPKDALSAGGTKRE